MATYHIETDGCTSNRGESRRIERKLRDAGHYRVDGPDEADVTILNICTVVEKTERNMLRRAEELADETAHLIDHGFREHRLHRTSATLMAENDASRRLCERLGFVHEGTARETQFTDGGFVDAERYGLLEREWDGPDAVLD